MVLGCKLNSKMCLKSFSRNALIFGLKEPRYMLCLCTIGVHHVRDGMMFPTTLSKYKKKNSCKKSIMSNNLNDIELQKVIIGKCIPSPELPTTEKPKPENAATDVSLTDVPVYKCY